MSLRVLLILTIFLQQLTLPMVAARAESVECGDTACCQVVEYTTCCGKLVTENRCGKTGGECFCAVQPGDSAPAPPVPPARPHEQNDLNAIFVAGLGSVFNQPIPIRTPTRWMDPAVHRSHNETQALLCIWRT